MTKTFTIHGMKIRSASQRRYIVVAGRHTEIAGTRWDHRHEMYVPETFKAFIETVKRSDNYETAKREQRKYGRVSYGFVAVIDTTTGEEV